MVLMLATDSLTFLTSVLKDEGAPGNRGEVCADTLIEGKMNQVNMKKNPARPRKKSRTSTP